MLATQALAAAVQSYAPESMLFAVNTTGVKAITIALAAGIAFGFLRAPFARERPDPRRDTDVQRHSVAAMALHWVNALAFLLAIFTAVVLLKWLPNPLTLETTYVLHYVAAGLILFAIGAVATNALVYGTTSKHRLIPSAEDLREFGWELLSYLGLRGEHGFLGFGRRQAAKGEEHPVSWGEKYLGTERVMSYPLWVVIVGLLVVTGLIKGLRYTWSVPHAWLNVVTVIHDGSAIAAMVMLVLHAGAVLVVKTNWPLLKSMVTTREPIATAAELHPGWVETVSVEESEQKKAAGA